MSSELAFAPVPQTEPPYLSHSDAGLNPYNRSHYNSAIPGQPRPPVVHPSPDTHQYADFPLWTEPQPYYASSRHIESSRSRRSSNQKNHFSPENPYFSLENRHFSLENQYFPSETVKNGIPTVKTGLNRLNQFDRPLKRPQNRFNDGSNKKAAPKHSETDLMPYSETERTTVRVPVPKSMAGYVIGKANCNLVRLARENGVAIGKERGVDAAGAMYLVVEGTKGAVRRAVWGLECVVKSF